MGHGQGTTVALLQLATSITDAAAIEEPKSCLTDAPKMLQRKDIQATTGTSMKKFVHFVDYACIGLQGPLLTSLDPRQTPCLLSPPEGHHLHTLIVILQHIHDPVLSPSQFDLPSWLTLDLVESSPEVAHEALQPFHGDVLVLQDAPFNGLLERIDYRLRRVRLGEYPCSNLIPTLLCSNWVRCAVRAEEKLGVSRNGRSQQRGAVARELSDWLCSWNRSQHTLFATVWELRKWSKERRAGRKQAPNPWNTSHTLKMPATGRMYKGRDTHFAIAVDVILPIIYDQREVVRCDARRYCFAASCYGGDGGGGAQMLEDYAETGEARVVIGEDGKES